MKIEETSAGTVLSDYKKYNDFAVAKLWYENHEVYIWRYRTLNGITKDFNISMFENIEEFGEYVILMEKL